MASCVCVFQQEGNSGVSGSLKISQPSESSPSTLEGQIRGLTPGQKHGISVCTYGDLSDGSASCGSSFNPFGKHGDLLSLERRIIVISSLLTRRFAFFLCVSF